MPSRRSSRLAAVLAALAAAAVSIAAARSALTTPSKSDAASSEELLAEVRGLRADFQQVAKISVQAQLLVARLQLQEQRINVVAGQLREVQQLVGIKESGQIPKKEQVKQLEDEIRRANVSVEQQRDIETQITMLKAQIALMQKEVQDLRAQEIELSNQLTAEQGRWLDFNSRLDEMERLLPASRR
jgi:hypothetical protein